MIGNKLAPVAVVSLLDFQDIITDPPSTGDPGLFRKGSVVYYRDTAGVLYPLVTGADGAGVVTVMAAMSPYTAQPQDRVFLVDSSAGAVTVKLIASPIKGQPAQFVDAARSFAAHALTIDGNGKNINGSSSLTVNVQDALPQLIYGGTTWETGSAVTAAAASIVSVNHAASPYTVKATDQVLLVDTSAGTVTLNLEASPATGRQPLSIVDATRSFATNNTTVSGNGHTVNGSASITLNAQDGGLTLYWAGAGWECNVNPFGVAAFAITGTMLQPSGLLRFLTTQGHNGAGTVTLTGAKAGDYIIGISNVTDHATLVAGTDFTQVIATNNQAAQLSATDLSAKTLQFLLVARS